MATSVSAPSETPASANICATKAAASLAAVSVRIKALANVKYHFTDEATGYGPENIATKRVGKNLHIAFEGGDVEQPDLVIEDYYKDNGEIGYDEGSNNMLVGMHENGNVYPYDGEPLQGIFRCRQVPVGRQAQNDRQGQVGAANQPDDGADCHSNPEPRGRRQLDGRADRQT